MPHAILNIKTASVTVSGLEFGDAITNAALMATQEVINWTPISGDILNEVSTPTYTVDLEFGQDLASNATLTGFLWTNQGTTQTVVIKPQGGATPSITASVLLKVPSQLGGPVGIATATVSLPVNGTPSVVFAA